MTEMYVKGRIGKGKEATRRDVKGSEETLR